MNTQIRASLLALPLLALPTYAATPQTDGERIEERCTEYLWELFEKRQYPGCSAALVLPGGEVVAIVAVIDRQEGARKNIEHAGYTFKSIFTKSDLGIGDD